MPNHIDLVLKPLNDYICCAMDTSWKRVLEVVQNHVETTDQERHRPTRETSRTTTTDISERPTQASTTETQSTLYEREQQMAVAFHTLFTLVRSDHGFLAFISTITSHFEYDDPVAMAFLTLIIDKSTLPSRETLISVLPIIVAKLNKKPSRMQRMVSVFSGRYKIERSASKREALRKQLICGTSSPLLDSVQNHEQSKAKRNAATLWSLLALKYAGEMCLSLWGNDVCDMLIRSLADTQEDLMVRVFSLLAIEKFALTGSIKEDILSHELNIRDILISIVKECEAVNRRIYSLCQADDQFPITPLYGLNSFNNRFIPSKNMLREEWAKYIQLSMLARWALDRVFMDPERVLFPWDVSGLRVIMNPFDSSAHIKVCGNGLELRNDCPHFESVRGTTCVKKGKWYYETLVLTNGIIHIGWATSRCRFAPEENCGVGDDCNSFAFDTYRAAVWVNGSAIYPQKKLKLRCQAGDVVGCFLDLDNAFCSYYINGRDLGLTVKFEQPSRKAQK